MRTIYKIFPAIILVLGLALMPNISVSQIIACDPDVPFLTILPHPDTNPSLELEGKVTYAYRDSVYIDIHCGQNKHMKVDPCDPWKLEFYVKFWEQNNDAVKVLPPLWNWDTTECQDVRFDIIEPDGYVYGTYTTSAVVMKVTMIPHKIDNCIETPNYHCIYGNWVDTTCWVDCLNERIRFECQDSCEIPNQAICSIEWDKPLPVELASFNATVKDNNVTLNWATTSEENNARFVIERMYDGIWAEAGYVAGSGSTSSNCYYAFTDKNLKSGLYNYRLRQVDYNGNIEYYNLDKAVAIGIPGEYVLAQNYPNPFNPFTTIMYGIPKDGNVTLKVYDINGREIATLVSEPKLAGFYTVDFNASGLSSGVYFYKFESGTNVIAKKMIIMK